MCWITKPGASSTGLNLISRPSFPQMGNVYLRQASKAAVVCDLGSHPGAWGNFRLRRQLSDHRELMGHRSLWPSG